MAEETGSIYSEIRVRLDKLKGDLKKVDASFDNFAKENKKTTEGIADNNEKNTKKVTKNWLTSFSLIKVGGVAALAAVGLAFKKAVGVFATTEQSLANVQAASNATAADFKRLEEAAFEAGETTRFSASQSADALFFLASAGLEATESVEALDSVLLLAGATGSDLATTASVLTATMSQFSIEAKDAADISNIFAAANSNSQATMEKLGSALRQVGPIAGTFGIGLEEVVGSLQELFNAGFRGEAAGVALRNAIGDLANPTSTAVKKLNELGVSFDQVDPGKVGFTGAIQALEEAEIDATKAIEIFGKESGPQLATLLKAGSAQLRQLQEDVTGTSEAARQYAVQNDTLAGSFDSFKSKLESFGISLIGLINGPLRGLIEIGGKILGFFTDINKSIQASIELAETQNDLRKILSDIKKDIPKLADEYIALAEKEFLSNEESVRQRELTIELRNLLPGLTQAELDNANALRERAIQQENVNKLALEEKIGLITQQLEGLRKERAKEFNAALNQITQRAKEQVQAEALVEATRAQGEALRNGRDAQAAYNNALEEGLAEEIRIEQAIKNSTSATDADILSRELLGKTLNELSPVYAELTEKTSETVEILRDSEEQLRELNGVIPKVSTEWDTYSQNVLDAADSTEEFGEETEETANKIVKSDEEILSLNRARLESIQTLQNKELEIRKELAKAKAENIIEEQKLAEELETEEKRIAEEKIARDKAELDRENALIKQQEENQIREIELLNELEKEENERARNRATIDKELGEQRIRDKLLAYKEDQENLEDILDENLVNEKGFGEQSLKNTKDILQLKVDANQEALDQETKDIEKAEEERVQAQIRYEDEKLKIKIEAEKKKREAELETADFSKNLLSAGEDLFNIFYANEIAAAEGNDEEISRLKREQFIADKIAKAGIATVNGLVAVSEVLANPFLAIGVGVASAANVAAILAQPVPQFQTGGMVIGGGASSGTTIGVAENGSNELMLNNSPAGADYMREFSQSIAREIKGSRGSIILQIDGLQVSEIVASYLNKGNVKLEVQG